MEDEDDDDEEEEEVKKLFKANAVKEEEAEGAMNESLSAGTPQG